MLGGISLWQLLIVLAIVVLIFGTKKLRNMGGDLGGFLRGFKSAMKEGENEPPAVSDGEKPKADNKPGSSTGSD